MQCKVISLPLEAEAQREGERQLNDFLKVAQVKRVFASLADSQKGSFWSVLFFYDELGFPAQSLSASQATQAVRATPIQPSYGSDSMASPIGQGAPLDAATPLTGEQVKWIIALKRWRADQAAQEGVPLYMVAQNKWLEEIVRMPARGVQDLLKVRGMGEWRTKKYGTKILEILGVKSDSVQGQHQWNQ